MTVDKFGNEVKRGKTIIKSDEGISLGFANDTYIRLDGESDITGNLNMALRKIENLGYPTNPRDATNKEYVDNIKGTGIIGELKDETVTIKGNLDFEGKYKIINLADPRGFGDVIDLKTFVERVQILRKECLTGDAFNFINNEYRAKQNLNMVNTFTLKNLMDPVDENDAVNRKYVDKLNSAFVFRNNEYYAKGNIYLRNAKLGGLREPTQDGEATTKKYVDELFSNQFVDGNDNIAFGRNVDMEGKKIFDLPLPKQDDEPATKKYVDDSKIYELDRRGNVKFDRNINLDNKRIFAMKEPKKDGEGANKKYVDQTIAKKIQEEKDNFLPQDAATKNYVDEAIRGIAGGNILVSKEGVFIKENGHYRATAPLDIDNQKVKNIPDPVDKKDAVNRKYVDEVIQNLTLKQELIRENGGFNLVDSYINMNFNNIRNLGNPIQETDAVPRSFVDNVEKNLEEKIEKRKQLIAASASYHGNLISGKYQFTWGGQSNATYEKHDNYNGFLIPQNGYIKSFTLLDTGIILNLPENTELLDHIANNLRYNTIIPFFTLILIRHLEDEVNIGTLYFYFVYGEVRDYTFKFNPAFDEKTIRTVKAKDIINIRTQYNSEQLSKNSYALTKKSYNFAQNDFFTYLATVLIELDPLDD